eukprot:scaffold53016_cov60-Attheya_sp.AAC.2
MIVSSFEYDCDCRYLSSARARGRAVTGVIVFLAMTLELCPAVLVMILVAVAVGRVIGGLILRVEGADRVCIAVAAVGHDFPGSVIVCGMEGCMLFTFTAAAPSTTGGRIRRKGTQSVHGGRHGGGRLVALFVMMISITRDCGSSRLPVTLLRETASGRPEIAASYWVSSMPTASAAAVVGTAAAASRAHDDDADAGADPLPPTACQRQRRVRAESRAHAHAHAHAHDPSALFEVEWLPNTGRPWTLSSAIQYWQAPPSWSLYA